MLEQTAEFTTGRRFRRQERRPNSSYSHQVRFRLMNSKACRTDLERENKFVRIAYFSCVQLRLLYSSIANSLHCPVRVRIAWGGR